MANKKNKDVYQEVIDAEKKLLEIKHQLKEAKKKLDEAMGVNINMDANSIVIYKGIDGK